MEINRKNFSKKMQDNDEVFLSHFEAILDSVDDLCSLQITKSINSYTFRIAPSLPKYHNIIIEEILKFYNIYNIKLDMGKSMKTSGIISFALNLDKL